MVSTKWNNKKERSFASSYFIFRKFSFSLRTSYKELTWCTNHPNVHIHTFRKRWSFIWRGFFPMSILKKLIIIPEKFFFTNHILRNIGGPRKLFGVLRSGGSYKGSRRLEGVLGVPKVSWVLRSRDWVPLFHHAAFEKFKALHI